MKVLIKIFITVLVISAISALVFKIFHKIQGRETITENIQKLPSLSFTSIEGGQYSLGDTRSKSAVILMYFSPDCEHCQYMTKKIRQNIKQFAQAQIVMITFADRPATEKFASDYRLDSIKNITVVRDTRAQFPQYFGTGITPVFYIYKNGSLAKTIKGETKIENLISAVK